MLSNDLQPEPRMKDFKACQVIFNRNQTVNVVVDLPSSSMFQIRSFAFSSFEEI